MQPCRGRAGHAAGEGLLEMTRKGLGMTAVVDGGGPRLGYFTDGDLRRALDRAADLHARACRRS
jgi:arabinose-5-phosphate isomerase